MNMFINRFRRALGWGTALFLAFYFSILRLVGIAPPLLFWAARVLALTILPTAFLLALPRREFPSWLRVALGALLAPAFAFAFVEHFGPRELMILLVPLFFVPGIAAGYGAGDGRTADEP